METFNDLEDLMQHYDDAFLELKYEKAEALLSLLNDEEYINIWEENPELMNPIQESNEYLHDSEVLDKVIALFTDVISKRETKTLIEEITSKLKDLPVHKLKKIASSIQ